MGLALDLPPTFPAPDTTVDFAQLYQRAWGVARRLCPRIGDPGYDLEDMVQVAVIGAWQALSSVPVQSPEHAWHLGYQAMRKAVWSEFRRLYRTPDRTFDPVDMAAIPSGDGDPLSRLVGRASVAEIRAFIESLSSVEQDALARSVVAYSHGRRGAVRVVLSKSVDNALQRVRRKAEVRFGQRGVDVGTSKRPCFGSWRGTQKRPLEGREQAGRTSVCGLRLKSHRRPLRCFPGWSQ